MSDTNHTAPRPPAEGKQRPMGRRSFIIVDHDHTLQYSKGRADQEADRLAALHPGRTFYVLRLSRANLIDADPGADKLSKSPSIRAVRVEPEQPSDG